ncbi:MAG: IS200/IS605 family accessory protein TnpB-related protein [Caldilineaceae bacterium]|nr:IS200/IS605 family accessory protein TnpB-related protein [Caldilineaceae bacterium]
MQHPGTYQTRVAVYVGVERKAGDAVLSAYGELYGRVEHKLFAEVAAGRSVVSLKRPYLQRYRIPARMFNAVRVSLEGRMASVRAQQKLRVDSLGQRIAQAERRIRAAAGHGHRDQVHQQKRRWAALQSQRAALQADMEAGRVRLCFGSKQLWWKQHHLEENGYASHQEWLRDWREARSDEFFVLGSRDETAGCQLCVATVADDGSLTLRLRLPDCLAPEYGKYLTLQGVRFAYGHAQVLAALESNAEYTRYRREHGEQAVRATVLGQAISYRFKRDAKGWRVFATTDMMDVPVVTDKRRGAIGVDLNADHLAVAETDASGNPVHAFRVPLVTYGKSRHQAEAIIGDAVARVVAYARAAGKPIVIERLDFRQKKAALKGESRRYRRMLSSFSYGKIKAFFLSRGYRQGVEVRQVNPAFSSVIGRVKFMERYGLSVHQAAALVLARRLLGCSERIPRRRVAPVGHGVQVAFTVPARKRVKHVWTYWGAVSGQLGPALAAQHRLGRRRGPPNPVQAARRVA